MAQQELEVEKVVGIYYSNVGQGEITKFLIRWKGFTCADDTWEPIENLQNCQQAVSDFMDLKNEELDIVEPKEGDYFNYLALRKNLSE